MGLGTCEESVSHGRVDAILLVQVEVEHAAISVMGCGPQTDAAETLAQYSAIGKDAQIDGQVRFYGQAYDLIMVRTAHPGLAERAFGTIAQHVIREDVAPVIILPGHS